ncbi:uroporphyrinogen-III C-methyltransferase [Pseudokineococcus lusitanus]|uniref:Uroporphyrinogen-III C-methyltransferase n=1 Tax=Pseudokineococcus lusitanus TaxID=763993 RepID=A0A3N1GAP7_9ACTN|nr:uroporphyrinogen-III C-methyltransferase [Pseudokineococcus lusitanus]ROP27323.1 uroporphyrinogen-III C-methyltransferase [Pseudokineococcus lusitanus]
MTDLLPLHLRLDGRRVVVVGGGAVAARSVEGLLAAGGDVHVVAPAAGPAVAALAAAGRVRWDPRGYADGDLDGAWLVVTATGVPAVDAAVSAGADRRRLWCLDRGDAARATAWTPAVARVDDVVVSVGAGGDPRRAGRLARGVAAALERGDLPLRRSRPRAAGRVALVGGGPGDVGLLTLRGRRLLAEADVVVVDRLGPRGVLEDLDEDVLVVDVGKTSGNHPVPQERINELLVEHGLAGRLVVRLKGGDPYVLGRGGEELAACRAAGLDVEVVPGVTSAVSVPAAAGIPVTHRGVARGVTVLTGHEDLAATPAALAGVPLEQHTVVLLMGVSALRASAAALVAAGRSPATPVAVVEDGYGPRQRATFGTLADVADVAAAAGVRPPAVVVVGDVVRLAPGWPGARPGAVPGEGRGA